MNCIAGQSVLAGKRRNAAILQPAEPARSRDPDRPVRIDPKVADEAVAQPVGGAIVRPDLTVLEVRDAPVEESKPQTASNWIGGYRRRKILMSQRGPGYSFGLTR